MAVISCAISSAEATPAVAATRTTHTTTTIVISRMMRRGLGMLHLRFSSSWPCQLRLESAYRRRTLNVIAEEGWSVTALALFLAVIHERRGIDVLRSSKPPIHLADP